MVCAILLLDAILPLRGLNFNDVLLTRLGSWPLLPTQALFPMWGTVPSEPGVHNWGIPSAAVAWLQLGLLFAGLALIFGLYLLALRRLPAHISRRYIFRSTLLLGVLCMLIPVVTSPDLFSYLIYARMGVVYHLNPLTTLPTAIQNDPVYPYLYWIDQPSAYGPTWAALTCLLQWLSLAAGPANIVVALLGLRLLGLAAHLGSTWLIWSIGGYLQREKGYISPELRLRATLAFAWNPLLLFEACVNAHNDATLLLIVLCAIWLLVRGRPALRVYAGVAALLALATCLKINVGLLLPGFLLFLWTRPQRWRNSLAVTNIYVGLIILLYAPFWQGGALLSVLSVNPSTYRNINTLVEFVGQFFNGLVVAHFGPIPPPIGSPAERVTHSLSMALFALIYALLCWKAFRNPQRINTPARLIRWMALAWLLYCAIGTPWFWPWYLVTFFGLYALIESTGDTTRWFFSALRLRFIGFLRLPLAIRLLAISMLALYGSFTLAVHGLYIPGLPGFELSYTRGLVAWLLPLLALRFYPQARASFPSWLRRLRIQQLWSRRRSAVPAADSEEIALQAESLLLADASLHRSEA